jgi:hypothetical protein
LSNVETSVSTCKPINVEPDEEVKKILRRLENIEYGKIKNIDEQDRVYGNVAVKVFESEPTDWVSFVRHNIPYLDFPLWLAEMVDKGELTTARCGKFSRTVRLLSFYEGFEETFR